MNKFSKCSFIFGAFGFIVFAHSCTYEKAELKKTEVVSVCDTTVSYAAEIAPLINAQCIGCHTPGGGGAGDFSTYEGFKLKVDNGSVNNRVITMKDMPTPGSGFTLTNAERQKISCWIEQGAPNN